VSVSDVYVAEFEVGPWHILSPVAPAGIDQADWKSGVRLVDWGKKCASIR
jgi:hypothetical protein